MLYRSLLLLALSVQPLVAAEPDVTPEPETLVLEPLADYLDLPESQRLDYYPFLRCGAMSLGYHYFAGDNFDPETRRMNDRTIEMQARMAAMLKAVGDAKHRGDEMPSEEDMTRSSDQVREQMDRIALSYQQRFTENFVRTGQAYATDPLIAGDMVSCTPVNGAALARLGAFAVARPVGQDAAKADAGN